MYNKKKLNQLLFLFLSFFALCLPNIASAESQDRGNLGYYLLGPESSYFFSDQENSYENISSESIASQFKPSNSEYPNFGIRSQELWLKVDFHIDLNKEYIFEVVSPLIHKIRFFQSCDGELLVYFESGMNNQNPNLLNHPNYQFPVKPYQGNCQFYLAIQSNDSLTAPMFIWDKQALQKFDITRHLLFGLFFGLMISLALYNFLLYLSIQNRAYLWYVFYILSFIVFYLSVYGYFRFLFGPVFENGISYFVMFSSILTSIFALLFGNQFLQIKQIQPKLSKLIYAVVILGILLFIPIKFVTINQGILIGNIYPGIAITILVYAILVSLKAGYKPAIFFAIAWGTLLVTVSIFIEENLGLIPGNALTHYGQIFGASLEAVLLSLALGYRFNDLRVKEAAARESALAKEREALELERAYTKSMQRFVPQQFLRNLDKTNILQVKKGDAKSVEMAVLFTDIRGFTSLSERVGTQETFAFLNRYLEIMEPIVESHGGFIDKFIGDAIMALFIDPKKAVEAAIAMVDTSKLQKLPDESKLEIGIGIHFGELILGTVGTENRLETTVIGDTVNLASRIESLTKQYSAKILVSLDVLNHLPKDKYNWKELESVSVRGKSKPISLFHLNGY
jgi:class 3 adenylate cyclase